jgi:hypothetical protein
MRRRKIHQPAMVSFYAQEGWAPLHLGSLHSQTTSTPQLARCVQGMPWSSDKEIEAKERKISGHRHLKVLNLQGSRSNQFDQAIVNQGTAPDRWRTRPSDRATVIETIIRQCSFVDWGAGEVAAIMFPLASHSTIAQR